MGEDVVFKRREEISVGETGRRREIRRKKMLADESMWLSVKTGE